MQWIIYIYVKYFIYLHFSSLDKMYVSELNKEFLEITLINKTKRNFIYLLNVVFILINANEKSFHDTNKLIILFLFIILYGIPKIFCVSHIKNDKLLAKILLDVDMLSFVWILFFEFLHWFIQSFDIFVHFCKFFSNISETSSIIGMLFL